MTKQNTFLFINFYRETIMAHIFEVEDTIRRHCRRYNAVGTLLTVRLLPPLIIVIL